VTFEELQEQAEVVLMLCEQEDIDPLSALFAQALRGMTPEAAIAYLRCEQSVAAGLGLPGPPGTLLNFRFGRWTVTFTYSVLLSWCCGNAGCVRMRSA